MSEKRTQTPLARAQIVAIGILMSMISMAALGVVFAIGLIDSNAAIEDVATSKIVANVLLAVGFIALGLSYGLRTKLAK
ncbi:MAG TPA: hypothetical protein PK869_00810, partial [Candidatus Hydrogenedentes bacterium]|nr:hypothetical protein [Candidatus Hydrogenedentota bacterium]